MPYFPLYLSVVVVVSDGAEHIEETLRAAAAAVAGIVSDYEILVVAGPLGDEAVDVLQRLTSESGQPNLQVFLLTKPVDADTASWVGIENALGDFIAVIDPLCDDINYLPEMLHSALGGADVVFARNRQQPHRGLSYSAAYAAFNLLYQWSNGVHLDREAPHYRLLSRRVVNFVQQHPHPAMAYRHLPATGGFARVNLNYSARPKAAPEKSVALSLDRGMRLLVSTTRVPMRIVTALSLFGAVSNLLYSVYVIAILLLKQDVAPGWVTLSLQQSGMFFLISLVLMVLGEYIVQMARLSNEGPPYHIARELTSTRMTRREKLNVEETMKATLPDSMLHLRRPA